LAATRFIDDDDVCVEKGCILAKGLLGTANSLDLGFNAVKWLLNSDDLDKKGFIEHIVFVKLFIFADIPEKNGERNDSRLGK